MTESWSWLKHGAESRWGHQAGRLYTKIQAGAPRPDALLPPEMAIRAEETGVKNSSLDALGTLALAVLAGA